MLSEVAEQQTRHSVAVSDDHVAPRCRTIRANHNIARARPSKQKSLHEKLETNFLALDNRAAKSEHEWGEHVGLFGTGMVSMVGMVSLSNLPQSQYYSESWFTFEPSASATNPAHT